MAKKDVPEEKWDWVWALNPLVLVTTTDREGFKNVKKAKEKESCNDEERRPGYPEHRDKEAHDLINDNSSIVLLSPVSLCLI